MSLLAHHHALLAATTAFHYAEFDGSALVFPAGMPAFQTLAFYERGPAVESRGGRYLLDGRPGSDAYVYGQDVKNVAAWVNGTPITDTASLSSFYTDQDVRVVLECHDFVAPTLLSRYTQEDVGRPDGNPVRLWQLAAYNRVFTAAEKAATSGPFPTSGLVAAWDFKQMSATSIPDVSGHGYPISVVGLPGTIH